MREVWARDAAGTMRRLVVQLRFTGEEGVLGEHGVLLDLVYSEISTSITFQQFDIRSNQISNVISIKCRIEYTILSEYRIHLIRILPGSPSHVVPA